MIINPYRFGGAADPVADPLHYWDFTDLTATAGGGIYDQGSGNWGALTSTFYPVRLGGGNAPDGVSSCLDFTSGTTDSDHLTMSTSKAWDGGTNDLSISMWVYHDNFSATNYHGLLTWRDNPGAGNRLTWLRADTSASAFGRPEFFIYDVNDNNDVAEDNTAGGDLAAGQWYHYCAVWNSTTEVMDLYIDNALYATTTTSGIGNLDTTAHEFVIGSGIGSSLGFGGASLDGRMFAVGIYNYPLTTSDISHLYNSGNGRLYADL